jgi:hypothetical protein
VSPVSLVGAPRPASPSEPLIPWAGLRLGTSQARSPSSRPTR